MLIANIIFYVFSITLVLSALMVITVRNPVHSVLFLIFSFFNASALFVLLGAEFIAMLLVIVYVGAVAVLFLFVIMMLNVNFNELRSGFVKYLPVGFLIALIMLVELVLVIQYSVGNQAAIAQISTPILQGVDNTTALGMVLYTKYAYPFQLSGMILLVAMIGAIVLTNRTREDVRKQKVSKQIERNRESGLEIVKVQSRKGV
jgi:NADH-quinone oxidoreductase subunit J